MLYVQWWACNLWMQRACVFGFFFLLLFLSHVQTWGVFGSFVHAVAASENWTPGSLTSATTGVQANECLKQKNKGGRKEGGQERGKRVSITVGDGHSCSTPLGLCKCIISKFCYMFYSLTSLVTSNNELCALLSHSLLPSLLWNPYTLPLPLFDSSSLSIS